MTKSITLREFKERAKAGGAPPEGLLRKQVTTETKAIDRDELTVDFTISTAAKDRENDTIAVSGWELAEYLVNPVVLWAHDHGSPPVAQALNVTVTESALRSRAKFTPREIYPFGHMIFQMYAERFLRATSVGFIPLEWKFRDNEDGFGIDFLKQELLEFSCVPVPANPEALALARAKGIDLAPLCEWAEQVLDAWEERKDGLWLPRGKVEAIRKDVIEIVETKSKARRLTPEQQDTLRRENLKRIRKAEQAGEPVIELDDGAGSEEPAEPSMAMSPESLEALAGIRALVETIAKDQRSLVDGLEERDQRIRDLEAQLDKLRGTTADRLAEVGDSLKASAGILARVEPLAQRAEELKRSDEQKGEQIIELREALEDKLGDVGERFIEISTATDTRLAEHGRALEACVAALALLERLSKDVEARDGKREHQIVELREAVDGKFVEIGEKFVELGELGEQVAALGRGIPDANAQLAVEIGNANKSLAESIGKSSERLVETQKTAIDRIGDLVTSLASDVSNLKHGIELNVERKLLDFELAIDTKIRAALADHVREVKTEIEQAHVDHAELVTAECKQQLEISLDRFKDYYGARTADLETQIVKHSDRVDALFRDQRPLLLRVASKIDAALERDVAAEAMAGIADKLDAFGEALRELVDAIAAALDEAEGEAEDEDDDKGIVLENGKDGGAEGGESAGHLEIDASDEAIATGVRSAVSASVGKLTKDALNRIRGRLD